MVGWSALLGATGTPGFNISDNVFYGHAFKQLFAFHRVVAMSGSELI